MRRFFKDDFTGESLHFLEVPTEVAVVVHGLLQLHELLRSQSDGDSFLRDLSGPLVASPPSLACGAILDGAKVFGLGVTREVLAPAKLAWWAPVPRADSDTLRLNNTAQ